MVKEVDIHYPENGSTTSHRNAGIYLPK